MVVDSPKEDFYMQYKLHRHPDGIKVLPIADMAQHVRYTSSARLLKCQKHAVSVRVIVNK